MTLDELIAGFRRVATASVADAVDKIAGKTGFMDETVKPRINDRKIVGPAVTILEGPTDEFLPPQHALDAIDQSAPGSVICIAISGEKNVAVWGGLMTAGAVANKHEGAVLDGGVRDITEIRRDYDFPVFSRSVSPGTTLGRFRTYSANEPVMIGGVIVHAGDIIVADVDGVVVVPREHAEAVLSMAKEIDDRELEQAKLIIEAGSLRQGLAKYGRI
ncbi:dimethylmenaquinone methyltransferase protein (plasmid) [Rhizobium etli]|uniref:Putative 4-hydroxy-4-methyl-2-oxoglutarate aldolase n=1 Tax=Rhizobium etli TaxID=29449 RepID=A0AAN1BMK3_RHIET|nr:RraA family protein [Rhizobium etli]AGS26586.1 dimethylmenaquinone methyltransferase protein [Rhizobium etli bv. mimosae str. Mim1]ARQ13791.1 dimethylmenaquinone methyltransferase protein [Rhizobium etli]